MVVVVGVVMVVVLVVINRLEEAKNSHPLVWVLIRIDADDIEDRKKIGIGMFHFPTSSPL